MGRAVLATADWKQQARAGTPPADTLLRKQYIPDAIKAGDPERRSLTFTISTGAVDRERDTLAVDGWEVEDYLRNPVVLFAHQSRALPIAKATSVVRTAGQLKATTEFTPPELFSFGDLVYRMVRAGFLSATSVGFQPKTWVFNEERGGFDFKTQTLLEFSIVPVPANPEALLDGKAAGTITERDVTLLKSWCEQTLDELNDEPGVWLPRAQVGAAFKALSEPRTALSQVAVGLESVPTPPPEPVTYTVAADAGSARAIKPRPAPRLQINKADIRDAISEAVHARIAAEVRRHTGRLD